MWVIILSKQINIRFFGVEGKKLDVIEIIKSFDVLFYQTTGKLIDNRDAKMPCGHYECNS